MGRPWFTAKKFGVGLSPTWPAGWIALAIFIVVLSATNFMADAVGIPLWGLLIADAVELALFLCVVWMKKDDKPWRWRWGGRDQE